MILKRHNTYCYNKVSRALVCVCACAIYILGLSGCNNELESVPVELELRMAISASGISNSQRAPSVLRNEESDTMQLRAFGDPGTTETFDFPKYHRDSVSRKLNIQIHIKVINSLN